MRTWQKKRRTYTSREVSNVHIYNEGAEKYFQANWLALVPTVSEEVLADIGIDTTENEYGLKNLALIVKYADGWAKGEDKYYKAYGQSILALRDTLKKHLPEASD